MNEDLKFRYWDKNLKKMTYVNGIFNKKPYTEKSSYLQYESSKEYHDVVVMRCIGEKDSQDKDIYEGDIVEWEYFFNCICISKVRRVVKTDIVKSHPVRYWFENEAFGMEGEELETPKLTKIIGNIFENYQYITSFPLKELKNGM
jgi:uncharacterized phage protein (TIGR01671 family)